MDIRNVSDEEKCIYIAKTKDFFNHIRSVLTTLESDIENKDLMIQASAVWISGQLATWFNDFMKQIRAIHTQKDEIQKQISEIGMLLEKDEKND
jgi:hypothetical protein